MYQCVECQSIRRLRYLHITLSINEQQGNRYRGIVVNITRKALKHPSVDRCAQKLPSGFIPCNAHLPKPAFAPSDRRIVRKAHSPHPASPHPKYLGHFKFLIFLHILFGRVQFHLLREYREIRIACSPIAILIMPYNLSGRNVLITGGSRLESVARVRIGHQIANRLVQGTWCSSGPQVCF